MDSLKRILTLFLKGLIGKISFKDVDNAIDLQSGSRRAFLATFYLNPTGRSEVMAIPFSF